mmetsp:Transcript_65687/g.198356  ORF Transcript_65687/g.198356 Transcript_65687/m.198356 type:complete len:757 (-) Transcript_65687:122-2392(-)
MWLEPARRAWIGRAAGIAARTLRGSPPALCRRPSPSAASAGVRKFSAVEVAPAIRAAGLPEAVALGIQAVPPVPGGAHAAPSSSGPAEDPGAAASGGQHLHQLTLRETINALHRGTTGQASLEKLQPLVERSLALADAASLEELADLADAFVAARLRLPLRDLMPKVSAKLAEQPDIGELPNVVRMLTATGRGSLFFIELFEFCSERMTSLSPGDMATFVYEGGRHGLRCRHLIDAALARAAHLVPQMALADLMRTWQGFVRFSRDRKDFYLAAQPKVRAQVGSLSVQQLLLALRAARDLKHNAGFIELHAACSTELIVRMGSLSLGESAQCLANCTFSPKYRAQAQGLVRSVEQLWSRTEDLAPLRVVELVDALETFASWGMKPLPLIDRLDALLVERQVELKYTGNVSLWVSATQAFSRMEHMDAQWPRIAIELARDPFFVEKISFYQQCGLVSALGRLRCFDETAYKNIAELLASDSSLFKEVQDLAPVLWAYATANYFHQGLFDAAYDLMISWFEEERMNLTSETVRRSLIQAVWSLAVAGYHRRYESFAAFLDYAFFGELATVRVPHLRRLSQLADAVLLEAPDVAALCQYPERLQEARTHSRVRSIVMSDPSPDPELFDELQSTLQELSWPHEAFFMPDDTSAFYVDLSLAPKAGENTGLLVAGRFELLRVGVPGEQHPEQETGLFALARRLLRLRGWGTAVIHRSGWDACPELDQRRALLEDALRRAKEDMPAAAGLAAQRAAAVAAPA